MKKLYLLLPLFLLAACKKDKPQSSIIFTGSGEDNTEITSKNAEIDPEDQLNLGKQYTDLTLPTLEGEMVKLSDIVSKNKVTVIHCWASWSQPSLDDIPTIARLHRKYHDLGVGVIGISFDSDPRAWNNTIKINDMIWPQMCELLGMNNHVRQAYDIRNLPHTIIINHDGEIVAEGMKGEAIISAVASTLSK